jgi:hypothetical protein
MFKVLLNISSSVPFDFITVCVPCCRGNVFIDVRTEICGAKTSPSIDGLTCDQAVCFWSNRQQRGRMTGANEPRYEAAGLTNKQ